MIRVTEQSILRITGLRQRVQSGLRTHPGVAVDLMLHVASVLGKPPGCRSKLISTLLTIADPPILRRAVPAVVMKFSNSISLCWEQIRCTSTFNAHTDYVSVCRPLTGRLPASSEPSQQRGSSQQLSHATI